MVDCYQYDVTCPVCQLHFMALSSRLQLAVQPCGPFLPVRRDALQYRAQISRIVGERPRVRGRREWVGARDANHQCHLGQRLGLAHQTEGH
jgi:hypothetical protein